MIQEHIKDNIHKRRLSPDGEILERIGPFVDKTKKPRRNRDKKKGKLKKGDKEEGKGGLDEDIEIERMENIQIEEEVNKNAILI